MLSPSRPLLRALSATRFMEVSRRSFRAVKPTTAQGTSLSGLGFRSTADCHCRRLFSMKGGQG